MLHLYTLADTTAMDFILFNPLFNCVIECSRIIALVCVVYWFIKRGNLKSQMHKWIIAANNLFLISALIHGIAYINEFFFSWFAGVEYEQYAFVNRITGPYWWAYLYLIANSVLLPNLLWFKPIRHSAWILPALIFPSLIEPIIIVTTSFHRDYLPTSWTIFNPFFVGWINLLVYAALLTATYYIIHWHQKRKQSIINQ